MAPDNPVGRDSIVYDGQVVGFWRRTIGPDGIGIAPELFDDAPKRAITAAARTYADFLGLPLATSKS